MERRSVGDDLNETRQSDTKEKKASSTEIDSLIENLAAVKPQRQFQRAAAATQKGRADKAEVTVTRLETRLDALNEVRNDLLNHVRLFAEERGMLVAQVATANAEIECPEKEASENRNVATATHRYDTNPPKDDDDPDDVAARDDEEGEGKSDET